MTQPTSEHPPADDRHDPADDRHDPADDRHDPDPARHTPGGLDIHALWIEHRRWVAAVLLAHKPRWADTDDLLQDVAAAVVAHQHTIRDQGSVRPWLRTVAINAARLAARKGKLRRTESLDDRAPGRGDGPQDLRAGSPGVADHLARGESAGRLHDLAMALPEGYREPLFLKAVQGLSYRNIAEILGLPETTVETRIARARRMLRDAASNAGVHRDPDLERPTGSSASRITSDQEAAS